jgi:hypothetical protein
LQRLDDLERVTESPRKQGTVRLGDNIPGSFNAGAEGLSEGSVYLTEVMMIKMPPRISR